MSKPIRIAILADGKQAKGELRSVGKEATALGKIGRAGGKVLKTGLLGAAGAVGALAGTALVKGFGRLKGIEEAEAKLAGLKHTTSEVKGIMGSALKAVKGTAFGLDEAATTAASAVSAGVKPGKALRKYLTLVGDAAVQTNTSMADMGRVMNKVRTLGGAYNDTLQVLAERGLPVYQMLAKELGVSTAEVKKLASEGKISADVLEKVLAKRIGGAAQKAGKTMSGSWANAQAALGRLGAAVLKPTFKRLPKILGTVTDTLDKYGPAAERAGKLLGKGVARGVDQVETLLGKAGRAAEDLFKPGALSTQAKRLDTVRRTAGNLWDGTKKLARGTRELVSEFKAPAVKTFNAALDGTLKTADGLGKVFNNVVAPGLSGTAGLIGSIPDPIKEMGIQAGIAALLLPRVTSAADSMGKSLNNASIYTRVLWAEFRDGTTRSAMLSKGLGQLGGMARNIAGVGGMVALTQGAQTSNKALSTLANVGGGALLGFSVAGPIGAAVGGTAGGLLSLWQNSKKADDGLGTLKLSGDDLRSTMDDLTGATTAATRQLVLHELQKSGVLKTSRQLGLTDRQVVNGIVGQGKARQQLTTILGQEKAAAEERVTAAEAEIRAAKALKSEAAMDPTQDASAVKEQADARIAAAAATKAEARARLDNIDAVNQELGSVEKAKAAKQSEIRATIEFGGAIKKLPKQTRVALRAEGITGATGDLVKFARQQKLTPKQIRFLVKAVDSEASEKKIARVQEKAKQLGKTKINMSPFAADVAAGLRGAEQAADRGGKRVGQKLKDGTSKAKPNLNPFVGAVANGAVQAARVAGSGGHAVGTSLGQGVAAGTRSRIGEVIAAAILLVNQTIAAAKRAAKSNSPSRRTIELGGDLAGGLAMGLRRNGGKAVKAMRQLMGKVLAAGDASGIKSALGSAIDAQIKDSIKGHEKQAKAEKSAFYKTHKDRKARQRFDRKQAKEQKVYERDLNQAKKKALKSVRAETKALAANGKALETLRSGDYRATLTAGSELHSQMLRLEVKNLEEASGKLAELTAAHAAHVAAVKASYVELGNVANFDEAHLNAPQSMLDQLRERVKLGDRFTEAVNRLRGMSLNETSLQQLLDKGPEGALAAAEALAAGGQATIDEVNILTGQLAAQGQALGTETANQFHNAGIAAAQGLVNGLASQETALVQQSKKLAKLITKAIRKQLKMKSPSRVTAMDGVDAALGLVVGVGRTEPKVRRAGVEVADALRNGLQARDLVAPLDPRQVYAATGGAAAPLRIELTLSAETVDQLTRGKRYQTDIDAWQAVGGRRAAP